VTRKRIKCVYEERGKKTKDLKTLRSHRQQTKYSENPKKSQAKDEIFRKT
jgi:hypothetical protein